jgi:hypothetical protein
MQLSGVVSLGRTNEPAALHSPCGSCQMILRRCDTNCDEDGVGQSWRRAEEQTEEHTVQGFQPHARVHASRTRVIEWIYAPCGLSDAYWTILIENYIMT